MIAVATVATASVASVSRMGHAVVSESAEVCNRRWRCSCQAVTPKYTSSSATDTGIERTSSVCGLVPPFQSGIVTTDEEERGGEHQSDRDQSGAAVDLLRRPDDQREPEDQQQVADHAARQRSANDLDQAVVDREERDDQLGRVAEGGIEEAADPRPGLFAPRAPSPPRSATRAGRARSRRARTARRRPRRTRTGRSS